ncbi:right-handed parallel beta-helix repeat-containing protein [Patescibacteria group bacterium]
MISKLILSSFSILIYLFFSSPSLAINCDITIQSGQSIVTQINKTTCLRDGTYVQQVFIRANNAHLTSYPGEKAVIDGQNKLAPNWGALIRLEGNGSKVSNLEIKNSAGMCLLLKGEDTHADNIFAHHCAENGILIKGDRGIVENSKVDTAATARQSGWSSCLTAARRPTNAIIRNNYVLNCGGEGISTYEAFGTLLENNTVENNYNSTMMYVSDAQDVIVRDNTIRDNGGCNTGLMMGDETENPPSKNIEVYNNKVYNTCRNFYWWWDTSRFANGGMNKFYIHDNYFYEATSKANVQINEGNHVYSTFTNNTIIQTISPGTIKPFINYSNLSGNNTIITNPAQIHLSPTSATQTKIGDANGDNLTNEADYIIWVSNYSQTTTNGHLDGDFNGSDMIDGADYIIWLNNYSY